MAQSFLLYENVGWRMRKNSYINRPFDPLTRQPGSDSQMAMAFNFFPMFQELSRVQVNVFKYLEEKPHSTANIKFTGLSFQKRRSFQRWSILALSIEKRLLRSSFKQYIPWSSRKTCHDCFHVSQAAGFYKSFSNLHAKKAANMKQPREAWSSFQFQNCLSRLFALYAA